VTRRVHLHVGAPKSGTTYLQSRLYRNAESLGEHGVLVPRTRDEHPASLAFRAALDQTGKRMGRSRRYVEGYWSRLVAEIGKHDGVVLVSQEAFVRADAAAVDRAFADLAALGDTKVEIVYTARDLARQLVSAWLEGLKHGRTDPQAVHLERARTGTLPVLSAFDIPRVVGTWGADLPRERFHIVTVPPSGADPCVLWRRFLGVAQVDPAWAPRLARRANEAVGVPEAQLLLALNSTLGGPQRRGTPARDLVRDVVVARGLAGRESDRVTLDPAHFPWVAERAEEWIAWLSDSGVQVHGTLDDLRPQPVRAEDWVDPAVPHPEVVDAAAVALAALIEHREGNQ
jgi:hypothetical protein